MCLLSLQKYKIKPKLGKGLFFTFCKNANYNVWEMFIIRINVKNFCYNNPNYFIYKKNSSLKSYVAKIIAPILSKVFFLFLIYKYWCHQEFPFNYWGILTKRLSGYRCVFTSKWTLRHPHRNGCMIWFSFNFNFFLCKYWNLKLHKMGKTNISVRLYRKKLRAHILSRKTFHCNTNWNMNGRGANNFKICFPKKKKILYYVRIKMIQNYFK